MSHSPEARPSPPPARNRRNGRAPDGIVELLPEAATRGPHVMDSVDRTGEITLERLLGAGRLLRGGAAGRSRRASAPARRRGRACAVRRGLRLLREDPRPHFPPQPLDARKRRARSADTKHRLLGPVIEQITGRCRHELFDAMLFGPLGLDDSTSYPHPPRSGASPEPQARVWSKAPCHGRRGAAPPAARGWGSPS